MELKNGNKKKNVIITYVDGNRIFEEIGEMFKLRKEIEIMFLEQKINIKNSVLDHIRYKQLNWYGHVKKMDEERLPRKILKWCPPERRKGRAQNS